MLLAAPVFVGGCSDDGTIAEPPQNETPAAMTSVDSRVLNAGNEFGLNLFSLLYQDAQEDNLFVSPLSISMALGMTLNGAEGETKTAMQQTLAMHGMHSDDINAAYRMVMEILPVLDPSVNVGIANSIWYREGFSVLPDFIAANKTYFDAEVQAMNFSIPSAAPLMNNWVSAKTNGKIESIIQPPIAPDVVMYLINAVYYKAMWASPFDPDATREQTFTLANGRTSSVQMMSKIDSLPYFENDLLSAVDVPYGEGAFTMTFILPKTSVSDVIEELSPHSWATWTSSMNVQEIELGIPRFTMRYEKELRDVLSAMGMDAAFNPQSADFSRISRQEQLAISKVKHKSFIEVNEEGTQAAAVTSVGIVGTSVPQYVRFVADSPFLFAIRERETGSILFLGIMMKPA